MNVGALGGQEARADKSVGRRLSALTVGLLAGVVLVLSGTPALAVIPEGAQATAVVGGPVANCPPAPAPSTPFAPFAGTVGGIEITGSGACSPLAANAEGFYTVPGSSPQTFNAECANQGGTVVTNGAVVVPTGTRINGGAPVAGPTTVTTLNTPVEFPNGQTAILNQVITTPTSVTRNAIVFTGGPTVGQVICGLAAYPLRLDAGGAAGDAPAAITPLSSSDGDDGPLNNLVLLGGGLAVVVLLAQVAVARRLRRDQG